MEEAFRIFKSAREYLTPVLQESAFERLTKPDTSDSKRPRVPSWDEILFGAPPSEDD